MSDSPIFDRMAADRGYRRLTASRTIPAQEEPQGAVQPDPILDSPVPLAPEEEVYVRPFVKVEGEPRGLASVARSVQDIPFEDVTIEECAHPHSHNTGIRGLLEHVGIDTSRGVSVAGEMVAEPCEKPLMAKVFGVDPQILRDQMKAHNPELFPPAKQTIAEAIVEVDAEAEEVGWHARIDTRQHAYLSIVERARSIALGNTATGEKRKRVVFPFNPLDVEKSGLSFTDFAHAVVEGFRKGYPEVTDYRFSTGHEVFEDVREVFIVEEVIKVTPDTVRNIGVGDKLEISFAKGVRKPQDSVLRDVQAAFRQEYPDHVMVAVKDIQEHEDGSATLTVEGQSLREESRDLSPVRPLSEMETAQHTE